MATFGGLAALSSSTCHAPRLALTHHPRLLGVGERTVLRLGADAGNSPHDGGDDAPKLQTSSCAGECDEEDDINAGGKRVCEEGKRGDGGLYEQGGANDDGAETDGGPPTLTQLGCDSDSGGNRKRTRVATMVTWQ